MEALAMLKFWKSNTAKVAGDGDVDGGDGSTVAESTISDALTEFSDDDDDSFFELELTLPNYSSKPLSSIKNDFVTAKKEPKITSKPQSPISILRSASPKLNIFMFGKFNKKSKKQVGAEDEFFETESVSSNFSPKSDNSSLFTVKFQIEDGSIVPKFTRTNSSKENQESSKRFSKDAVQKYFSFVKPSYAKSSKKSNDGEEKFAVSSPTRSVSSPRKEKEEKQSSRFNFKGKQLGKSKSASAMIGSPSPVSFPARNDNPCDGIEGAILHCKRSLNTSSYKGSSLSRCSSDPSHEKSIQVSEEI